MKCLKPAVVYTSGCGWCDTSARSLLKMYWKVNNGKECRMHMLPVLLKFYVTQPSTVQHQAKMTRSNALVTRQSTQTYLWKVLI